MNILYIGYYKQNNKWGVAGREYLRALRLTGHKINSRPIFDKNLPIIESAEFSDLELSRPNYDVLIQHCPPFLYEYMGGMKNVGLAFIESLNLKPTSYVNRLPIMDAVWVGTEVEKSVVVKDCSMEKVSVVPVPFSERVLTNGPDFPARTFKFYVASPLRDIDFLREIFIAFHLEFHSSEPVDLVICSKKSAEEIQQHNNAIKSTLRLYKVTPESIGSSYKRELIVSGDGNGLRDLHYSADCYILLSGIKPYSVDVIRAAQQGNYVICNRNIGASEYISDYTKALFVDSKLEPMFNTTPQFLDLQTSKEVWYRPDINDLRAKMRTAFELGKNNLPKSNFDNQFTHEKIAEKINHAITNI